MKSSRLGKKDRVHRPQAGELRFVTTVVRAIANRYGNKVVAAVAITVFVAIVALSVRVTQRFRGTEGEPLAGPSSLSPFDGQRAYDDLERIVALGPRPPGSPSAEQTRTIIRGVLDDAGLKFFEHEFEAHTPLGSMRMVNVVGIVEGDQPGIIALSNHYDTKLFSEFEFVGANDGGSTTAWMLEMARTLGPRRKGRSVWLIWFDGEEAVKEWSKSDSLYGSRQFVEYLAEQGKLKDLHVLINVDMIGDCKLGIFRDVGAPGWLMNAIWSKAGELGLSGHFLARATTADDDHMPFRLAGIPCINLIDFEYGGSPEEHQRNWHTPNDTIERVCAPSLQAVGDVIYHGLPVIEAYLNAQTGPN